jgi:hypothetical protein
MILKVSNGLWEVQVLEKDVYVFEVVVSPQLLFMSKSIYQVKSESIPNPSHVKKDEIEYNLQSNRVRSSGLGD